MLEIYSGKNPVVSVIMCTYNRAGYLNRSISSLIRQEFSGWELIVVDDGSTDNTFHIISSFMEDFPNIRYIRHSNRKLSLSKNVGLKAANSKYIAFLDSDDEYQPDYLSKRIAFMNDNPDIDLIEGGEIVVGEPFVFDKNNLANKIPVSECHVGPTFFGKTAVFLNLNGFDKSFAYSEDSEFWERASKKYNVKKVSFSGYLYYRDTPDSICNNIKHSDIINNNLLPALENIS